MDKYIFRFNEKSEKPKYIQVAEYIISLIEEKKIGEGEKLPPIRKYANELGVNNDTVVAAYKKLVLLGYAYQKMGSGTYCKRRGKTKNFKSDYSRIIKDRLSNKDKKVYIDFVGEGFNNEYFPVEKFKECINEVIDRDGINALTSYDTTGYSGLRSNISRVFWEGKVKEEDILILSGAQQGIDVIAKVLLNPGDKVVVEKPTYGGALYAFTSRRSNILEIDMEHDGGNLVEFEKILKGNKIKAMYLMSYFQNPTGISYSKEKKVKLLELAEKYDFYIIEDDYLSELIYDKKEYITIKKLDVHDRVIYIKSFSKIFAPGIRLGYMILPKKIKDAVESSKISTDVLTSSLMQRTLDNYIIKGYWIGYIEKLRSHYKDMYYKMIELLEKNLKNYISFHKPNGGLVIYCEILDSRISSRKLFNYCLDKGILITPAVIFYNNYRVGDKYFRLSFSSINEEEMEKGIIYLKEAFEELYEKLGVY